MPTRLDRAIELVTANGATTLTAEQLLAAIQGWPGIGTLASDLGYKFQSFDIALAGAGASGAFTSQTVNLTRVPTPGPAQTCSNVVIEIGTGGGTLTAGQNLVGVYSPAGVQLAITASQEAQWGTTGLKTIATTAAFLSPADSFVWVAILSNGTTPISASRLQAVTAGALNGSMTTANFRAATNVTGVTALPSPLVVGSNVAANNWFWAALS